MENRADAVIFDFDGVIADTRADVWASVEYAADIVGGKMEPGFMEDTSHVAMPEQELFRHIRPVPDADKFDCFCDSIRIHYRTMNPFAVTRLYPGIRELFCYLRERGIPWVVVSSKPDQALRRLIAVKGWGDYMPVHYSLDSIPNADTKAAVYGFLMKNDWKKMHPVCIGDTWSDIAAARECGFVNIAALYGDGDRTKLLGEQPDYTAEDGWELLCRVEQLVRSGENNG